MQAATQAIETIGTIDTQHHLVLDETLPITGPTRVRVSHLLPEDTTALVRRVGGIVAPNTG